ncbi:MAG: acylphosphatase [Chitinophagales bacterium]|nr:acylphosphatase [Chitinophagales bacterium]
MKHYNIRVTGKVQGVFFRDSTKKKAVELGVCGYVRNEADGSVFIEAEGEELALAQFLAWCTQGPSAARVDSLQMEIAAPQKFRSFEIEL